MTPLCVADEVFFQCFRRVFHIDKKTHKLVAFQELVVVLRTTGSHKLSFQLFPNLFLLLYAQFVFDVRNDLCDDILHPLPCGFNFFGVHLRVPVVETLSSFFSRLEEGDGFLYQFHTRFCVRLFDSTRVSELEKSGGLLHFARHHFGDGGGNVRIPIVKGDAGQALPELGDHPSDVVQRISVLFGLLRNLVCRFNELPPRLRVGGVQIAVRWNVHAGVIVVSRRESDRFFALEGLRLVEEIRRVLQRFCGSVCPLEQSTSGKFCEGVSQVVFLNCFHCLLDTIGMLFVELFQRTFLGIARILSGSRKKQLLE